MNIAILSVTWITTVISILMYMPQVYKGWTTKDVSALSPITFSVIFFGCLAWSIYGAIGNALAAFLTNVGIAFLMLPLVYLLLKDKIILFYIAVVGFIVATTVSIILMFINVDSGPAVKYLFVVVAGSATSVSFVPQVWDVIKTKNVQGISLGSMGLIAFSQAIWILYWILKIVDGIDGSYFIAISFSAVTLICSTIISYKVIKHK